jgi:hypothetical protein
MNRNVNILLFLPHFSLTTPLSRLAICRYTTDMEENTFFMYRKRHTKPVHFLTEIHYNVSFQYSGTKCEKGRKLTAVRRKNSDVHSDTIRYILIEVNSVVVMAVSIHQ